MKKVEIFKVDLKDRSYDIVIGPNLIGAAAKYITPLIKHKPVIIITDDNVAKHHLNNLVFALEAGGITHSVITLPPGESTKSFDEFKTIISAILDAKPERSSSLIAFGGGVIGDLVGFAASVILRGIDFFQIPTTLLAQVDSSVGGKTGINTHHGKNLIGTFYQPRIVLADTNVLETLPKREFLSGYAEIVKYGLMGDKKFFEWLEINGEALLNGNEDLLRYAIMTSCCAKARFVKSDEKEFGSRALLNFGHTFGHALEANTGFGSKLLHGEAVAIGMIMAFDLSVLMGLCQKEDASRVRKHFLSIGLPTQMSDIANQNWESELILNYIARDKKVQNGKINFILTRGIGHVFMSSGVDTADLVTVLNQTTKI